MAGHDAQPGRLPEIALLEEFRASLVDNGPALGEMQVRLLLDTLGLGNKQAFEFLSSQRPDRATFLDWVFSIAGTPDPVLLARYHAIARGDPLPAQAESFLHEIEAMPDVLDTSQLSHWDSEGYVVLPEAISAQEAGQASAALWEAINASPDDPASWYRAHTQGIMVPLYQHRALDAARQSRRIHKAFAQLWGDADLWVTTDQAGFNPPEDEGYAFNGSPMHWDVSLVTPIPFATQAVLYLTDTAHDQGAFQCVPGFHKRIETWLDDPANTDPRAADWSDQARTVPGQAGDMVIWRQDLPHGASPNRSAQPRLVQYLNYYSPSLHVQKDWR
ncbi:phytanoyl-CoA dioxygenase family protein [Parerythrobacter jejuensis]|uniref:Phytanoyl-CoA dioxygenase n=1 Tax=Parerythrobacter jejuensis TaxID=795812 RepID=A0A845AU87_9SPHN|nr:phytanoyl-CoA dioxygenase family protein [Parerythrobacter jejuensis]MXP30398.1 phytanoyl-CoA dioxygenase [Parerythrobacter jejuensis]MXP33158.1 phytanoyl-CoA dioxygenase [Parerythrobacter jejuensis]